MVVKKLPGTGSMLMVYDHTTRNEYNHQVMSIYDSVPDVAGRGDFHDGTNGYSAQEYFYDMNGNTMKNDNKKISTLYNFFNLPSSIYETNTPANKIEYVYTSAGEKLKQRLSTGATLLYLGNFVYILDGTANGIAVKYILTPEGRATYSSGAYTYEYFMKDHLGNTRVSFNVPGSTAVIVQQSDYYPYGMMHKPQAVTTSDNRHLFNGKELQNNLLGGVNLDWYDYGARFYDPQIGRFPSLDPISDNFVELSPYNYASNNPVTKIDLWGLQGVDFFDIGPDLERWAIQAGYYKDDGSFPSMQNAVKYSDRPEKKAQIDAYAAAGMLGLGEIGGALLEGLPALSNTKLGK